MDHWNLPALVGAQAESMSRPCFAEIRPMKEKHKLTEPLVFPVHHVKCRHWIARVKTSTINFISKKSFNRYSITTYCLLHRLSTTWHPPPPTTHYRLPTTWWPTVYYLLPTTTSTYYYLLLLPTTTYYYLLLPTTTYYYLLLPTTTYYYLLLIVATSTYCYLLLPTATYYYRYLLLRCWRRFWLCSGLVWESTESRKDDAGITLDYVRQYMGFQPKKQRSIYTNHNSYTPFFPNTNFKSRWSSLEGDGGSTGSCFKREMATIRSNKGSKRGKTLWVFPFVRIGYLDKFMNVCCFRT